MELNLKKHFNDLIFLPLGGANEIGMNLNLYHLNGKWIMIDCGVGFTYNIPGIDLMTPDISFIKQHRHNLLAIILTHIHEDHMGAIQYLWEELKVPVYASQFAGNFLRAKLSEYRLEKTVPIHVIDSNSKLNLDPFQLEFIGLTHSVPEMKAVLIKTAQGNVLHTGDWKFDPDPVIGEVSEIAKIKNLGENQEVLAMICDSTNAINEGHSRSEGELYQSLKNLIAPAQGLVGVATFASNIARVHTIAKIAHELGRKIVLSGFSLHRLFEVGKKSGFFLEDYGFISDQKIKNYNKNEILAICTGCQGEEMASVRKIANGVHPYLNFTKNDLMIFSSKIIPGNEKKIFELFDLLAKRQISVMTEKDHFVHVSGHPSRDELREMYQLVKPKIAIPVHGEFLHTKNHCDLAKECSVERVIQTENGLAIRISKDLSLCEEIGKVKSGYFGIDGYQLIDLKSEVIRERKKLQETGIIIISIAVNDNLKLKSKSSIISVGSYPINQDPETENLIHDEIILFLKNRARELNLDDGFGIGFLKKKKKQKLKKESKIVKDLEKQLRSRLLKIFEQLTGKRSAIEVIIHLVD